MKRADRHYTWDTYVAAFVAIATLFFAAIGVGVIAYWMLWLLMALARGLGV